MVVSRWLRSAWYALQPVWILHRLFLRYCRRHTREQSSRRITVLSPAQREVLFVLASQVAAEARSSLGPSLRSASTKRSGGRRLNWWAVWRSQQRRAGGAAAKSWRQTTLTTVGRPRLSMPRSQARYR